MSRYSMAGTAFAAVPLVSPGDAHPYWTFARVARALGTGPAIDAPLAGVSTDSRQLRAGDLFVALRGERFDAHDLLADAKAAGAAAFVVSDATKAVGLGLPTYVVPDTLVALGQLATTWRRAWGRTVIAVAGSNGKTSTKDLLKAALDESLVVHATAGNLNNQVGVPLTLLALPSHAEVAVVEVGTNMPGEVALLRAIAEPDIALVTSIGEEHLEGLGDLAGVLREETDIFHGVALAIVPAAHPEVEPIARARARTTISAGLNNASITPVACGVESDGRPWLELADSDQPDSASTLRCLLPLRGAHQAANAMLALAVARACGVPLAASLRGMANMPVPAMRGVVETHGDLTLVNDAYNANPASMRAAIALLAGMGDGRQRVAVLGSMRELGPQSAAHHRAVAEAAVASPVALIGAVGDMATAFAEVAPNDPRVVRADDIDALWTALAPRLARDAVLLLKASRGVRLERLVPTLIAWATSR
jgi:UDP-N-acetylmuramoyl-tripeptide--D-alanyl-D-alanine ligase